MHVVSPLNVRGDPGLHKETLAYARPGTEVTYTGSTRTVDGVVWYLVRFEDPLRGTVFGWVSSYYLSTGRSRGGFEPETVPERFTILTNADVLESGGALMGITSNWLQIRDGPTGDYAVVDAPEWGRVVRWTGRYIEEGGHTWYEVIHNKDTRGWARGDRVEQFVPHPDAPAAPEGRSGHR